MTPKASKAPPVTWDVEFHDDFVPEFDAWDKEVREELVALAVMLREQGPNLPRPYSDVLSGSDYSNLKELRFKIGKDGLWRIAYAFDRNRKAILLVGGNKFGSKTQQKQFYKKLIQVADERLTSHLNGLKGK